MGGPIGSSKVIRMRVPDVQKCGNVLLGATQPSVACATGVGRSSREIIGDDTFEYGEAFGRWMATECVGR